MEEAHRPNKCIKLKCTRDSFYRTWLEFLTPFHHLAKREKDVAARILLQYTRLKDQCESPAILRELLWSKSSKRDMITSLGISKEYFHGVLGKLREVGVLDENDDINPRLIARPNDNSNTFELRIVFDMSSDRHPEVPVNETVKD